MRTSYVLRAVATGVAVATLIAGGAFATRSEAANIAEKIAVKGTLPGAGGGTVDLEFQFYDSAIGGSSLRRDAPIKRTVALVGDAYAVELDVPRLFYGEAAWLEVSLPGQPTLAREPRREILPVPYALSLRPGARIAGSVPGGSVLGVEAKGAGRAIWAQSTTGPGVCGVSDEWNGVEGVSRGREVAGILGTSLADQRGEGVHGEALGNSDCMGVSGVASSGVGVYGAARGAQDAGGGVLTGGTGVRGEAQSVYHGTGVQGLTGSAEGYAGHFRATGTRGIGIWAEGAFDAQEPQNCGWAAVFRGDVEVLSPKTGKPVLVFGEGLDYAEGFPASGGGSWAPGTVLAIDAGEPGKLTISRAPYERRVAGVVTGAKGMSSGVRLAGDASDVDVALAGRVFCNVDATEREVLPGDLLTTSATPGYAMAVTDFARAQGAVLGKAMEGLPKGAKGQILVLVTLQ
jgi:hypothetical protein